MKPLFFDSATSIPNKRILVAHDVVAMASCHDYFSSTLQAFKKYFSEFAVGSNVSFFNV